MDERPIEFFLALEEQVWDALSRGDGDADRALLAPDFVGLYATGFADRSDHADLLADGPTVASHVIADATLIRISPTAALLLYRADHRPMRAGVAGPTETMYVSSLWAERDGRWTNIFSQDTSAGL